VVVVVVDVLSVSLFLNSSTSVSLQMPEKKHSLTLAFSRCSVSDLEFSDLSVFSVVVFVFVSVEVAFVEVVVPPLVLSLSELKLLFRFTEKSHPLPLVKQSFK